MSYATIDYHNLRWPHSMEIVNQVENLSIFLPHFKISNSQKYAKKVLKQLNTCNINRLVISDELLKNKVFCEELFQKKKIIITGRNMYKALILRILKDVASQMKIELKKIKLLMLIDDYSFENVELIRIVAKEVKSLSIVTTDQDKFEMIKKDLYNEHGIVIKIFEKSVNSFKNINIMVNVDFPSYDMNKINIANNTLIICGFAKHFQIKKNFNGILIRNIDIIDENNFSNNVNDLALCEAKIYSYLRRLKENDRLFEREGFKINGYFGENGKINLNDFIKLGKNILDK